MSYPESPDVNPYAPPVSALESVELVDDPESLYSGYAGFGRRFAAFMLDNMLVAVLSWVAFFVIMVLLAATLGFGPDSEPTFSDSTELIALLVFYGIQLTAFVAYYAGLESSSLQATPGKLAMGLRVTDLHGHRISFGRALGRLMAKIPSGLILYIGFLMAAFTAQRQALHDMMAGTLVVQLR